MRDGAIFSAVIMAPRMPRSIEQLMRPTKKARRVKMSSMSARASLRFRTMAPRFHRAAADSARVATDAGRSRVWLRKPMRVATHACE